MEKTTIEDVRDVLDIALEMDAPSPVLQTGYLASIAISLAYLCEDRAAQDTLSKLGAIR